MAQADFQFIRNTLGVDPEGGLDGRSVIHSAIANPLILEGDFGRRWKWLTGDTTVLGMLGQTVDGGIWEPTGTTHGFDLIGAVRVTSAGTPNKAIGLSAKTGRVGFNPTYANLATGYHLILGAWNVAGTVYGSPNSLTLLMVPNSGDGADLRSIPITSGLETDFWYRIRLSVIPNGAVEDIVRCYIGVKNAGLNAATIAGAPAGVSGASADMSAVDANSHITVTGLAGMTVADVGGYITFFNASASGNNGTFYIVDVPSATEILIVAAVDANGVTITPGSENNIDWDTRQVRLAGLSGLTNLSTGRSLTLSNATDPSNNGTFFIASADDTQADVVNKDGVIPDLNNGFIEWIEGAGAPANPLDPIWTELHTEVIDSSDDHYVAWGTTTSDRMGFVAHNSSGAGGEVFLDAFAASREVI